MKVVAFGELLLRLDTRRFERFVQAEAFAARYTGGEANVAVALAQWGVQTFAVSKVPVHEIGQAAINYLRRYGVNTDHIARGGQRLGILYVEAGASQRPSKVIYDRAHSSFREIEPGDFNWDAILSGKDWLHVTGTAPALGKNVRDMLRDVLSAANRLGVTVSFDCNYRSTLWAVEEASAVLTGLMPQVNVFVGTVHDAEALFGIVGSPADSAAELRRRFGFRAAAYTMRQVESASVNRWAGLLCDANGCSTSREYEMHIVDRIGGGDAFTTGIIYGLLTGQDLQETVEFAAAASCLKHSIPGDFNLVGLDEVEQLMAGGGPSGIRR